MTTGKKLEQIAENQQKVFDAGYEQGQAEGGFVTQDTFNELLARVEYLEFRVTALENGSEPDIPDGFSLTFNDSLMTTNFTLSIDGREVISGTECAGKTFYGTEFTFGNMNENMITWTTMSDGYHTSGWLYEPYTMVLTENITGVNVEVH